MKFTLRAGHDIDLLTESEVDRLLAKYARQAAEERRANAPAPVRGAGDSELTDATGAATLRPYRVPQGYIFTLRHVIVSMDGASASAPFKVAGVAVEVRRDEPGGDLIDFAPEPDQTGQLPTAIKRIGYPLKNGEEVVVVVAAASANTRVYANVLGYVQKA